ncbi:hypothetical protein KA531_01300 [Candidatus Saccharibacteria bacterium]|nr:hypothetical protein [Candidatus Saccharibacteria bacterium]
MTFEPNPTDCSGEQKPPPDFDRLNLIPVVDRIILPEKADYCLVPITDTNTNQIEAYHPRDLLELINHHNKPDDNITQAQTVIRLIQEYCKSDIELAIKLALIIRPFANYKLLSIAELREDLKVNPNDKLIDGDQGVTYWKIDLNYLISKINILINKIDQERLNIYLSSLSTILNGLHPDQSPKNAVRRCFLRQQISRILKAICYLHHSR